MLLAPEKLTRRVPEIIAAAIRATMPVAPVETYAVPGPSRNSAMAAAPGSDVAWRPLRPGETWGLRPGADPADQPALLVWNFPADSGSNHWLRATLAVPAAWRVPGMAVLLAMEWSGTAGSNIESIAYVDGQALAGLDEFHRAIVLPESAHGGELLIRSLVPVPQPFGGLMLQLRDETIFRLGHTMRALLQAYATYPESDLTRQRILALLNDAYTMLDLREGWASPRFAESARAALAGLETARAAGHLGPTSHLPTLVATGHAHLDVQWFWPLWRTRQKVAHTVANALHLMERYPEYHFSMSQPEVYALLRADAPELYARLKQRAAEGRFEPVGMMWLEPDCNLTSGESLVRQLTHGARFLAEEFGMLNHIVWLPDVFGYSAALPQLMRLCGINCFMTTKISWNQFNRMPADTFRWRGIDGSEVLTHFVTATAGPVKHASDAQFYTYNGAMSAAELFGTWNHYRQKPINDEILYIYGHGDGGGGPTEEMLETARVLAELPGFPRVLPGRVDTFFQRLYERVWANPQLPIWSGELYLEFHRGTYTSQAHTKQANRTAELQLREAEWLNAWAVSTGAANRQPQLDTAWQIVLLQQFHDILPGSSIPQVYVDSQADFARALEIIGEVREAASAAVLSAAGVPGHGTPQAPGASLAVFNSLPWERRECVVITRAADTTVPKDAQVVQALSGEQVLLVETSVPAYGYAALGSGAPTPPISPPNAYVYEGGAGAVLENDQLRIVLDAHGEIADLYDLQHGRAVIAPGMVANQLVLYEDRPLAWDAWDIDPFYEEKPYPVRALAGLHVAEHGPLRVAIEITRQFGASTLRQRICLWRGSRRIDFATEVDWHENQQLLRVLFPLAINANRATCEIQFGAVERPTHRNTSWDWARFEVCAHRWVDLSEGGYGVALLNNGKYGHSLHHNLLGLSLLKSAAWPDPGADRGRHCFTYSLLPHAGDWRAAEVTRRAYELNAPLIVSANNKASRIAPQGAENGSWFLAPGSGAEHIVVETIKVAHDGDGLIVRLYEAHNQRGPVSLRFARPVASAAEADLLEREIGPLEMAGNEVRLAVRPFEVKTLRVRLA